MKVAEVVDVPPPGAGFCTDIGRAPRVALEVMVKFAVILVLLNKVVLAIVIPSPACTIAPVRKFVPVMVTATVAPLAPLFGLIPVTVGIVTGAALVVNSTTLPVDLPDVFVAKACT